MKITDFLTSSGREYFVRRDIPALTPDLKTEMRVINIYPDSRAQTVLGFGGAMTESSAFCWHSMDGGKRAQLIRDYFDVREGAGYNFCRLHIGSADFSLGEYAYTQPSDRSLDSFDLGQDREYVLPFLREALKVCPDMFILASPWSPPYWMKESGRAVGGGRLSPEWARTWAEYVARYIEAYRAEGIKIAAVTVQNEPIAAQSWESCQYTAEEEAALIRDHLAPVFEAHSLDTKIIIWDHNKERVYDRARDTLSDPAVKARVWGIGFHWYSGGHFDALSLTRAAFPDKPLIETEFCTGIGAKTDEIRLIYANELLRNLKAGMSASVDWNLILDEKGGPYHYRYGGCAAPIMTDAASGTIERLGIYYETAHFSRYIKRGAKIIGTTSYSDDLLCVAAENPDGEIAAVIINRASEKRSAVLRINGETAAADFPPVSISTILIGE